MKERWDSPLHSKYATDQQGRMWPSSEDFYNPLNPMYSCFLKKPSDLEYFDVILLRDGAYLLLDFFYKFPVPKARAPLILVPADLSFLIPRTWKNNSLCYKVSGKRHHKLTRSTVFLALASECFMSWAVFKPKMSTWLNQFSKDAEVSCFFSTRSDPVDSDDSEKKLSFEFISMLQHYFNNQVSLLDHSDLKAKLTKPENTFINLDLYRSANSLCSLEVQAQSQGAQLLERPRYQGFLGKSLDRIPLTFNTDIEIFSNEAQHSDFDELYFLKKTLPATGASLVYPIAPRLLEIMEKRIAVI